jgi:hypothetical protein
VRDAGPARRRRRQGLSAPIQGKRQTFSPTLSATYSDPEGDAGTVTFTVKNQNNSSVVRTVTSSQVSSGSTASVNLATPTALASGYEGMPWTYTGNNPINYTDPTGADVNDILSWTFGATVGSSLRGSAR